MLMAVNDAWHDDALAATDGLLGSKSVGDFVARSDGDDDAVFDRNCTVFVDRIVRVHRDDTLTVDDQISWRWVGVCRGA